MSYSLIPLVKLAFDIYLVIVIIRVIGSWIPARSGWWLQVQGLAHALTEPLLRPIRRALSPVQGSSPVDFSPVLLVLALTVAQRLIIRMLLF